MSKVEQQETTDASPAPQPQKAQQPTPPTTSTKRHHIPRRTEAHKLHDKLMREIVDPRRFAHAYRVSADEATPKKLTIDQLSSLVRGLKVKTRGSATLVRYGDNGIPGPGEYDIDSSPRTTIAPRFMPDVHGKTRFGAQAHDRNPGPGAYTPRLGVSSRQKSAPKSSMASRLNDTITTNSRRTLPGPGQYEPHKPLGSDAPQFAMHDRSPFKYSAIVSQGPGPGAYMLPPSFKGQTVADWSPRREPSTLRSSGVIESLGMGELSSRRYRKSTTTFNTSGRTASARSSPGSSQRRTQRHSTDPQQQHQQERQPEQGSNEAEL